MNKQKALDRMHTLLRMQGLSDKSTGTTYHLWIARFIDYMETDDVESLTIKDAQDYLIYLSELKKHPDSLSDEKKYADKTFNQAVNALRFLFSKVLCMTGADELLSTRRVTKIQKNPIYPYQADRLLNECQDPLLAAFIALSYGGGLRSIEIRRLKFKDIHKLNTPPHNGTQGGSAGYLTIENSKWKKTRTVPYSETMAKYLNEYCIKNNLLHPSPESYVFPSKEKPGEPITHSIVQNRFKRYLQTFDFFLPDQTFHGLRHASATQMANILVPLPTIQKVMGHCSAATTALYIHTPEEDITSLPDVLKREEKNK